MKQVTTIFDCIANEEKSLRLSIIFMNTIVWLLLIILTVATSGIIIILYLITYITNWLLSEYNVKKLKAVGATVSATQFPEVFDALNTSCSRLGIKNPPSVIIITSGEVNAFAIKFARKKVIVLMSEILEGIIDNPEELKFIIGHELAHCILDHGCRGHFEIYKTIAYKAARELTCDNAGTALVDNIDSAKTALKRLTVGNKLSHRLNEEYLIEESKYLYSGITGWLLKRNLTHPAIGKRIQNVINFFNC